MRSRFESIVLSWGVHHSLDNVHAFYARPIWFVLVERRCPIFIAMLAQSGDERIDFTNHVRLIRLKDKVVRLSNPDHTAIGLKSLRLSGGPVQIPGRSSRLL